MTRIGIVTAGGDAPGMNAAIRSIVRSAYFHDLEVVGFERGYMGLIEGQRRCLGPRSVSGIINLGGTILKTVRCSEMKTPEGVKKAVNVLKSNRIDALITIGGDGTFRGGSELNKASGIPVIGIPATIDNDVAGTDTTIGFDTAVNTALYAIDKIRDTATSHERIFVVEVMGRKRGFLALEVGLAGGAEIILVPEIKILLSDVCERLNQNYKKGKRSEIIVMAEGTGDSSEVTNEIMKSTDYEARLTTLGHIQRGGIPTAASRTLACEFGHYAVELVLDGEQRRMVGIRRGQIGSVNLDRSWKEIKDLDINRIRLAEILSL